MTTDLGEAGAPRPVIARRQVHFPHAWLSAICTALVAGTHSGSRGGRVCKSSDASEAGAVDHQAQVHIADTGGRLHSAHQTAQRAAATYARRSGRVCAVHLIAVCNCSPHGVVWLSTLVATNGPCRNPAFALWRAGHTARDSHQNRVQFANPRAPCLTPDALVQLSNPKLGIRKVTIADSSRSLVVGRHLIVDVADK